jgi:hypothetical protein
MIYKFQISKHIVQEITTIKITSKLNKLFINIKSFAQYGFKNCGVIRRVTSGELLTKQATREDKLYTTNTYILKLFLKTVTAGIEAPVVTGNTFCVLVSK